jgi:hypothetical protein
MTKDIKKMIAKAKNIFVWGQLSNDEGQYFRISKTAVHQAINNWNKEDFDLNRFVLRKNWYSVKTETKEHYTNVTVEEDLYIN